MQTIQKGFYWIHKLGRTGFMFIENLTLEDMEDKKNWLPFQTYWNHD